MAAIRSPDFASEVDALLARTNAGPAGDRYPMPRGVARQYVLASHAGHCSPECYRSGYLCPDCIGIRRERGIPPERRSRGEGAVKFSPAGGRGLWRNRFPPCYAVARVDGRHGFDRFRKSGLRRNVLTPFQLRRPHPPQGTLESPPPPIEPNLCTICGSDHLSPSDCPDYLPF